MKNVLLTVLIFCMFTTTQWAQSKKSSSLLEDNHLTFRPAPGKYSRKITVKIRSGDPETLIYYTLDNTDPTPSSSLYTSPIALDHTTTIKVIAVGRETSSVISSTYVIRPRRNILSRIFERIKRVVKTDEKSSDTSSKKETVVSLKKRTANTSSRSKSDANIAREKTTTTKNTQAGKKTSSLVRATNQAYTIHFDAGWNLISIPFVTNMTVKELFPPSSGVLINSIFALSGETYVKLDPDSKINPKLGYWMFSTTGGESAKLLSTMITEGAELLPGKWSLFWLTENFNPKLYDSAIIYGWNGEEYSVISPENMEVGKSYWIYIEAVSSLDEVKVPDNFSFTTIRSVPVQITSFFANGSPYPRARFIIEDESEKVLFEGYTDEKGNFTGEIKAFIGKRLFYRFLSIGLSNDKQELGSVQELIAQTTFVVKELHSDEPIIKDNASIDHTETLSASFLSSINSALPERKNMSETDVLIDPTLSDAFQGTNIYVSQDNTDVHVSFIHEGAGYKNSFGYFTWQHNASDPGFGVPTNSASLTFVPIFPNASYQGSGGQLVSGDTVYLGNFNAGTWIGFWNASNAWNPNIIPVNGDPLSTAGIDVNSSPPWMFFSIPQLNDEYDNFSSRPLSQHIAVLWHQSEGKYVLGFEDILRTHGSCDHDFNDVMFYVTANPPASIDPTQNPILGSSESEVVILQPPSDIDGDGIDDKLDSHPNDSGRAYVTSSQEGRLAFEDNFPSKGDYDFNDLMLNYTLTEIQDSNHHVKEFNISFKLVAMGADLHNAFALLLDTTDSNIASVGLKVNGATASYSVIELGHNNEVSLTVIEDVYNHFTDWNKETDGRFPNTWERDKIFTGKIFDLRVVFVSPLSNLTWPYNPYMIPNVKNNKGFDVDAPIAASVNERNEIHLMNYRPSERMRTIKFNTFADDSDLDNEIYYRDSLGFPWAMVLIKTWDHPIEWKEIKLGYPLFETWAMSGGVNSTNWQTSQKVFDKLWLSPPKDDNFNDNKLASFWNPVDFGIGTENSGVKEENGVLTITNKGVDVWKGTSQYTASYANITGDFVVEVKIVSQKNTHKWAKAGIMAKNDMEIAQGHTCFVARTPSSKGHIMQYDSNGDGQLNTNKYGFDSIINGKNTPSWVRLQRTGNTITSYFKKNEGDSWTKISAVSFTNLNATMQVGLFSVSRSSNLTGSTSFEDFVFYRP